VLETRQSSRDPDPLPSARAVASAPSEAQSRTFARITRDDVMTVGDVALLLELKPYTVKEYARRGSCPAASSDGPGGFSVLSLKRRSGTCRGRTKMRGNDIDRGYDHLCDHTGNNRAAARR
jgi:hypothetical protein